MSSQICPVCGARSTVELKWADGKWRCEIKCPGCGTSSTATNMQPGESRRLAVAAWEAIGTIGTSRRPRYAPLVGMTFACLSVVCAATALGPLWGVGALVWALLTCVTIACLTVSR